MKNIVLILFLFVLILLSSCDNASVDINSERNGDVEDKNVFIYDVYEISDGIKYLDFSIDNCVVDSGLNPYNVKQVIASSDLVVISSVKEYSSDLYMRELSQGFPEIYYVPLRISGIDVIKGDELFECEDLIVGNDGGYLSMDVFKKYIDTEVDLTIYSDVSEVRISYGDPLPEPGEKYIFCLERISDEYLKYVNVEDQTYEYIVVTKYLIKDGFIYLNGNVISDEETFMSNVYNDEWLNTVDKPDWALEITYIPFGSLLNLENSYGSDDTYRMVYLTEPDAIKPYGIGYHVWQFVNEGKKSDIEEYIYMSPELDSVTYKDISGVKIKVITIPGERSCACVYFSLSGIDVLIEGVYVDGTAELERIAEALIYEYQSTAK